MPELTFKIESCIMYSAMEFTIIVAVDDQFGIGKAMDIPWRRGKYGVNDMNFFKNTTMGHTVIMGRKTAESIPKKFWPLPGRMNIVLSSTYDGGAGTSDNVKYCKSLNEALEWCKQHKPNMNVFICGGENVYKEAIDHPLLRTILISTIPGDYDCDAKFPVKMDLSLMTRVESSAIVYRKDIVNNEEVAFLNLLRKVVNASTRLTRTSSTANGVFGEMIRFTLDGKLPLITTKKILLKSVFTELIWFLRGDTNIDFLRDNNVHIWDGNTTEEFLRGRKLEFPEGAVGAAYGHQWRHWGAAVDKYGKRTGPGFDQIVALVNGIIQDPYSRRHVVTAWNPSQLDNVALPPCHILFQMYVNDGALSCMVTMRSSDVFIGLPFNIASYSLLVYIIAHICNLKTGEIIFSLGDCHVYEANMQNALEQLNNRTPRGFPSIAIKDVERDVSALTSITLDNILIDNYHPYPYIKSKMVA